MSAGVVEREELAVDVEQGNLLALHLDQTRLTRLDLSGGSRCWNARKNTC